MDNKKRTLIQAVAAFLQNAHVTGFFTGRIYTGAGKNVCVPGLNCYSCPGALGACPVGSLQNALSAWKFRFPYYVLGLMVFFGAVFGRLVCGFLCPFGFLQELLFRIPSPRKLRTSGSRAISPARCCPGRWFTTAGSTWKALVLTAVVLSSIVIFRPFCKYLCPLGAFYSLFNRASAVRLAIDSGKCTDCGACARVCDMAVNPAASPNHSECIRCGKCVSRCPHGALCFTVFSRPVGVRVPEVISPLDERPERDNK